MNFKYLALISTLAFAGCGAESTEDETFMEGQWEKGCITDDDGGSAMGLYEFRGNKIFLDAYYYSDTSCEFQTAGAKLAASFSIGEQVTLNSGISVFKFNSTPNSVQVAYIESSTISSLNTQGVCGYSNWSSGSYKEVINCQNFLELADGLEKDIVKVDGGSLFFGDSDYLDTDGYPTRLESDYATKVE